MKKLLYPGDLEEDIKILNESTIKKTIKGIIIPAAIIVITSLTISITTNILFPTAICLIIPPVLTIFEAQNNQKRKKEAIATKCLTKLAMETNTMPQQLQKAQIEEIKSKTNQQEIEKIFYFLDKTDNLQIVKEIRKCIEESNTIHNISEYMLYEKQDLPSTKAFIKGKLLSKKRV